MSVAMDMTSKGIQMGAQVGFLDFSPECLETLICNDPITEHFDVEHTPFARGKFAAVRRVRCLRTGEYYAAKVVRKRRRARDVRYETLHEAAVLSLARGNPKIIGLHKVFETPSDMTLILELAAGGELQRVIDEEERIEERVVRKYLTHILTALRFLHSHNIAHLDLKPQNLLLTGPHPSSDVKLCDFGISRVLLADIEVREVIGTPDYVAPEILQYEPISLATDMWSVGVLSYVLLTGHSPFGGDTKQETFLNISQCQLDFPEDIFDGVSSTAKEFISSLLVVDPGDRLTVEEALSHQWLSFSDTIPTVSIHVEDESSDLIPISSLKRSSSPPKEIISNKENNKNLLNSSTEEAVTGGSSPPSKRECREHTESPTEVPRHRSTAHVSLSNCSNSPRPNNATSSPKTNAVRLCSPKGSPTTLRSSKVTKAIRLQSPHGSPKLCRSIPKESSSIVTGQVRHIEMKLQNKPSCDDLNNEDSLEDFAHQTPSVSTLKAKFSTQIKLNSMPSFRRNNLNKSFGSVDYDAKEKKETNNLSPACLRKSENSYHLSPRDKKYGPRRDFQDLVIKNGYIF